MLGETLRADGEDKLAVPLTPWRNTDDTIEGWDWSLPPRVKPVANSGLIFGREKRTFPSKGEAFDFHIQAAGADATISFVRVIKTKPPK